MRQGVIQKAISSRSESPSPYSKSLSEDVQSQAICLFFHDYIVDACPSFCEGYLDFLPALYAQTSEDSCLGASVLAASYANLGKRIERKDLALKASHFYQSSLEAITAAISSPQLATSDMTMTAIILLGVYEVSTLLP